MSVDLKRVEKAATEFYKDVAAIYSRMEMVALQTQFCKEKGYPRFMPSDGFCYRCGCDLSKYISAEAASSHLYTGCPHCMCSWCD